jgi:hypothetical protein
VAGARLGAGWLVGWPVVKVPSGLRVWCSCPNLTYNRAVWLSAAGVYRGVEATTQHEPIIPGQNPQSRPPRHQNPKPANYSTKS